MHEIEATLGCRGVRRASRGGQFVARAARQRSRRSTSAPAQKLALQMTLAWRAAQRLASTGGAQGRTARAPAPWSSSMRMPVGGNPPRRSATRAAPMRRFLAGTKTPTCFVHAPERATQPCAVRGTMTAPAVSAVPTTCSFLVTLPTPISACARPVERSPRCQVLTSRQDLNARSKSAHVSVFRHPIRRRATASRNFHSQRRKLGTRAVPTGPPSSR